MTDPAWPLSPQIATVFGGSGFLGRHRSSRVLAAQASASASRCAGRTLPATSQPFGFPGQIHPVQANLRFPDSVTDAVRGAGGDQPRRRPAREGQAELCGGARRGRPAGRGRRRRGGRAADPCLGARRRSGVTLRLCAHQGRGRGGGPGRGAGGGDLAPLRRLRARRQLLQPLRIARPHAAGACRSPAPRRASSRSMSAMSPRRSPAPSRARSRAGGSTSSAGRKSGRCGSSSNTSSRSPSGAGSCWRCRRVSPAGRRCSPRRSIS